MTRVHPAKLKKLFHYLEIFNFNDKCIQVTFSNVLVPASNLVFEVGAGFFMGQARLGPGRLHHCIRAVGCSDRAIDLYVPHSSVFCNISCENMPYNLMFRFVSRSLSRRISPSSTLSSKQTVQHTLAECIMSRDTAFASCMMAANALDVHGNSSRLARHAVAVAKVVSPR